MIQVKTNRVIHLKRTGEAKPESVHLDDELKSGGAGTIYSIKEDSTRVIKIYHPKTLEDEGQAYEAKLECMLGNSPSVTSIRSKNGPIIQIAWPLASAYTAKGEFVGFAMPMIDIRRTTELEFALSRKLSEREGVPFNLGVGISLAHNLAAIVNNIHLSGHAIVDLKPINLKFYKDEFYVSVLDCDGFYINLPGSSSEAPQVTLDYLAPEFQGKTIKSIEQAEFQDRFALALIIFKLLNYDTHPYACIPKGNYHVPSDIEEKIKAVLYPYGVKPHPYVLPVPASMHETLPNELRILFDRAFSGSPSNRPSAREWEDSLVNFARKDMGLLEQCNNHHLHFKGMPCGACFRENILSRAANKHQSSDKTHNSNISQPVNPIQHSHTNAPVQHQVTAPNIPRYSTSQQAQPQSNLTQVAVQNQKSNLSPLQIIVLLLILISFITGYFIGKSFWISYVVIALLLFLGSLGQSSTLKERFGISFLGSALLTGFIFASIGAYHHFISDPSSVSESKANNTEQTKSVPIGSKLAFDTFMDALESNNLGVAVEKMHLALAQLSADKDEDKKQYGKMLVAIFNETQKQTTSNNSDDLQKLLIAAESILMDSKVQSAFGTADSTQSAIRIHSSLANLYWLQRKFSDVIPVAELATTTNLFSVDNETAVAIDRAQIMLANSLLLTGQARSSIKEFETIKLLGDDSTLSKSLEKILQLVALEESGKDVSTESDEVFGSIGKTESEEALRQINEISSGNEVAMQVNNDAERLAQRFLSGTSQLTAHDDRPGWIGVRLGAIEEEKLGSIPEEKVYFSAISPGSPADQAGIKGGDSLVAVNGQSIHGLTNAQNELSKLKVGQNIPFEIVHGGKNQKTEVKPVKSPN